MNGNILSPLVFNQYSEAERHTKHHACGLCLARLIVIHTNGLRWAIKCPVCDLYAFEHNTVTKYQANQMQTERSLALRELRKDPKPTKEFNEAEVLKALGL